MNDSANASRAKLAWKTGLRHLAASGAILTTTESVMFEWRAAAGSPEFKQLSQLVKGS